MLDGITFDATLLHSKRKIFNEALCFGNKLQVFQRVAEIKFCVNSYPSVSIALKMSHGTSLLVCPVKAH